MVITVSSAFAASDDVYLRRDVFEAKFERVFDEFAKIHSELSDLKQDIKDIRSDMKNIHTEIKNLSAQTAALNARVDGLDKRADDLHNFMYLWIIIMLAVIALPYIIPAVKYFFPAKYTVSDEDIEQIIAVLKERKLL